ncbi:MAG TPA: 30S ribosomal protein S8 [Candidatus Paceibacterota bacterium]|nr:30S ribosomal protein S8 [Candidatus Paceibacterota bacterium]
MTSDRVGDFITRLVNASAIGKRAVELPYAKHLEAIARKLSALGFVGSVSVQGEAPKKALAVELLYAPSGEPKIRGVKRLSKPGRRLYAPHTEAHRVAGGTGARLFSTSKGILADAEARRDRAGGEALFEIW